MPGQAPPLTDERALLLAYLAQQRDGVRYAAYGLNDEQARATPTRSALSVGGLLKHVTITERHWIDLIVGVERDDPEADKAAAYADGFRMLPDESLVDLLAAYDEIAKRTEDVVAGVELDQPVPVPDEPWFPKDVEAWTVRWVLLHILEESARHAGHADIVRESLDGATMHPLMAAAEGWPATPWLRPWTPER